MQVVVGQHCSLPGCHQLDFLPFKCSQCTRIFCLEHHQFEKHDCSVDLTAKNVIPQCPLCSSYIHVKHDDDPDEIMNAHISRGCKGHILDMSHKKRPKCALKGCKNPQRFELVECTTCRHKYCLTHRHGTDHNCDAAVKAPRSGPATGAGSKLLQKLAQRKVEKTSALEKSATSKVYGQNKGLAQLQKQRAKLSAKGDPNVPERSRFFLDIVLDASVAAESKRRAIDSICKHTGVQNKNNDPSAKKLLLFGRRMPSPLPFDIPLSLLDPQVISGDSITLKREP